MGFFSKASLKNIITPREAYEMMAETDGYVLLDVRTPAEYRQARINGAKLIPVDELNNRAPAELPDRQKPILIYCQSGARATKAAALLAAMGYANVKSFGGIVNWPYGVVKG